MFKDGYSVQTVDKFNLRRLKHLEYSIKYALGFKGEKVTYISITV